MKTSVSEIGQRRASAAVLPDNQIIVIARDDDYTFGVLHSRVHELWALAMGTQLEDRPRYTPTTTFETFPFPHPTEEERDAISAAAKRLDELREGWLNPVGVSDEELEQRTLTKLYNAMPSWLRDAHATLDRAVLTAYAWPPDISDTDLLTRLLDLNVERAAARTHRLVVAAPGRFARSHLPGEACRSPRHPHSLRSRRR